jgi:hypothetical protein
MIVLQLKYLYDIYQNVSKGSKSTEKGITKILIKVALKMN